MLHLLLIWHLQLHFGWSFSWYFATLHKWKLYVQHQYRDCSWPLSTLVVYVFYAPSGNHTKVSKFNKLSSCFVSLHSSAYSLQRRYLILSLLRHQVLCILDNSTFWFFVTCWLLEGGFKCVTYWQYILAPTSTAE